MNNFRRVLKNPILLFMANRYVGYGLLFIRGILVAKFLGPQMFGVWGFLTLTLQYLSYTSLGMQYAVNVELATESTSTAEEQTKIIGSALMITALISSGLILLGLGIETNGNSLFEKYSFSQYALSLGIIGGLSHFRLLFTSIYRVKRKLFRIAISELLSAGLPLMAVLMFRGTDLINALLASLILAGIISIVLFIIQPPFKIAFRFEFDSWKQLLNVGIPLLVYSVSFQLIAISSRTVVSIYYPVETMGYYSLANTIAAASLLGLNAVSWVVFPDILSKTRADISNDVVLGVVRKVNDLYGTSVFLAVFGMILLLPFLFFFLPQYKPTASTLSILLLSQAVFAITFGQNCVAIARKKQLKIAGISVITVITVTGLSLLVALFKMDVMWVAVSVLVGSFAYTILQGRLGEQILGHESKRSITISRIFPWGMQAATLIFLIGILLGYPNLFGIIGVVVFILMYQQKLKILKGFINQKYIRT